MKNMYEPQIAEFIVHNKRMPFWEELNKESYIQILSITPVNDTQNKIQVQYDQAYIGFVFSDIFHSGVTYGMKSVFESKNYSKK